MLTCNMYIELYIKECLSAEPLNHSSCGLLKAPLNRLQTAGLGGTPGSETVLGNCGRSQTLSQTGISCHQYHYHHHPADLSPSSEADRSPSRGNPSTRPRPQNGGTAGAPSDDLPIPPTCSESQVLGNSCVQLWGGSESEADTFPAPGGHSSPRM